MLGLIATYVCVAFVVTINTITENGIKIRDEMGSLKMCHNIKASHIKVHSTDIYTKDFNHVKVFEDITKHSLNSDCKAVEFKPIMSSMYNYNSSNLSFNDTSKFLEEAYHIKMPFYGSLHMNLNDGEIFSPYLWKYRGVYYGSDSKHALIEHFSTFESRAFRYSSSVVSLALLLFMMYMVSK